MSVTRKRIVKSCFIFTIVFFLFIIIIFYFYLLFILEIFFFGTLSGIFCFFTCYDGAPLRSPVLEKGVMLGVLPEQR